MTDVKNDSGVPLKPVYTGEDHRLEEPPPGSFPYTRGIHKDMYRGRLWTMRQYAGFRTAAESNQRYQFLLKRGQTGLSVAFDLPTQIGYDSDDPMANGEVGKVGVAIDSLEDMEVLLKDIPLDKVSTSMTINATAAMLLLLYQLVAEKQGCPPEKITGTVQNDILKEYAARGTYIFPPKPSMRLITDLFAYCANNLPNWNTISISGYHMREAGSTAAEEVALTLSHAIAYVQAAQAAGLAVDEFAPRLSCFFACHSDFFEEVALVMMAEIDERGGAVSCIESGWTQRRIADSAYRLQRRIEAGQRVVVGVNRYLESDSPPIEIMKVNPRQQVAQGRALKKLRARRSRAAVDRHLADLERAARGTDNLMPPLKAALADYVTIGECCAVLRGVFGEYHPGEAA